MTSILETIVATKRQEIAEAMKQRTVDALEDALSDAPPVRDFLAALQRAPNVALIAEIKKASPSRGIIREDFQPLEIAQVYEENGAAALSVLTDREYFQGSLDILQQVRQSTQIPVLRKDFILDRYQLLQARAVGADAVLLIAECLDPESLSELMHDCLELGMTPLIEVYEASSLAQVLKLNPPLVGVNSRDLRSFKVDFDRHLEFRAQVPSEIPFVAESGIQSRADVVRLQEGGVDAILVGETFMAHHDIAAKVRELMGDA